VGDDPRRCAWAHALPDGQVLSVTYPAESLLAEDEFGSPRWLRLRAGVDLRGARHEHAQPMSFSLFLDDEEVVSQPISKFDSTWWAHTIDLSGLAQSGEVRLEIRAEDPEVRGRRFCFNGWVVDDDQARTLRDRSESVESSSSM